MKDRSAPVTLGLGLVLAACLAGSSCGYALAGRGTSGIPASIKRIAVLPLGNDSRMAEIDRILTEKILQEFQSHGRFTVQAEEAGADAVLTGKVVGVDFVPVSYNDQRQATRYSVVVTLNLTFTETADKKVLWANPSMQARDEYDVAAATVATDPSILFRQDTSLMQRVSQTFARSIVTSILEAF